MADVVRICLIGAESTGKTTLAQALAVHYRTVWVPEYGRAYTYEKIAREGLDAPWRSEEFLHIAAEQIVHEEQAARQVQATSDRPHVLFCDTDAFATAVWHERYLGTTSPTCEALAAAHRFPDLYLLTDPATPFEADAIRDGEHLRAWMHQRFLDRLTTDSRPFIEVHGPLADRLAQAIPVIDALVGDDG